jgi:hypothetical protein
MRVLRRSIAPTALVIAVAVMPARTAPRAPSLDTVVTRMGEYIRALDTQMATIVATEHYQQTLQRHEPDDLLPGPGARVLTRTLDSDYALVRASDRREWVGFRDTFDVDGTPVRDHDGRLERLVSTGALAQAARVVRESARFNLGADIFPRTVNVPTLVLHLLEPSNRSRFAFRKAGETTIDGVRTWQIDYRERERPTIVKDAGGDDQRSNGSVWVVPDTGAIRRTMVRWGGNERFPLGRVEVTWAHVAQIDTLVPVEMREAYTRYPMALDGLATYTNFRQFTTGARILAP